MRAGLIADAAAGGLIVRVISWRLRLERDPFTLIISENRFPPRIKSGAGIFGLMRQSQDPSDE
jgi:hypothetical protein